MRYSVKTALAVLTEYPLLQTAADAVQVALEVAVVDEVREKQLLQDWHRAGIEADAGRERPGQPLRQHEVADAQRGRDRLGERVEVDDSAPAVDCIERLSSAARGRALGVEVVLDDPAAPRLGPADVFAALGRVRRHAGREAAVRRHVQDAGAGACELVRADAVRGQAQPFAGDSVRRIDLPYLWLGRLLDGDGFATEHLRQ